MKQYELVIQNATVVTAARTYRGDVAVSGGEIAALGSGLRGARVLDATGRWLIPGGVDIHVHMQMPLPSGVVSSDTFYSGTRAAALGGTTTIVDFVAANGDQSLLEALAARRSEADPQVVVDYGLHMTLAPNDLGKLDQLAAVYAAGATTFKLYMAYGFALDDAQLYRALTAVAKVGGLAVVHAENWPLIQHLVAARLASGDTAARFHEPTRPALLEAEAVGRVVDIATFAGAPIHIFHVSCAQAAGRIAAARRDGRVVSGETCPHYLLLAADVYDEPGEAGKLPICAPPLRPRGHRSALWRALGSGELQLVSTDHCPFTRAEKDAAPDFSQVPGGVPAVELRLAALYSGGVAAGRFSANRWVDLCCTQPARLAGLPRKGDIAPGFDADLVLFDPDATWTVDLDVLHERVDWTPFSGLRLTGKVSDVFSRGEQIVAGGEFIGAAGRGRYVHRAAPQPV